MPRWVARYEEGYVDLAGEVVSLGMETLEGHSWPTHDDAIRNWTTSGGFSGASMKPDGDGFIQIDDVSQRTVFGEMGVTKIWRRIAFVLQPDDQTPTCKQSL